MTPSYSDGEGGCVGLEISTKHVTFTSIKSKLFSYAKSALHPCPSAPKGSNGHFTHIKYHLALNGNTDPLL